MTTDSDVLAAVIVPPTRDLGAGFMVRRALPTSARRTVGPFVFLDQMGPHRFAPGAGLDVRPHPHIGLATLTYLFDGEILHRDSLGTVMPIRPGEVNWMSAGRGIVHSERTAAEQRPNGSNLFGLQCWVALPLAHEEMAPAFVHMKADQMPTVAGDGYFAKIIAGQFLGQRSPLPTLSALFFIDVRLQAGASMEIPCDYAERAVYIVEGALDVGERSGEVDAEVDGDGVKAVHGAGRLLILHPGKPVTVRATQAARIVLLGGEPLDAPRALRWNFVSSSAARLEQATQDWQQRRFPEVPDETEWIPQPEDAGKPVFYP